MSYEIKIINAYKQGRNVVNEDNISPSPTYIQESCIEEYISDVSRSDGGFASIPLYNRVQYANIPPNSILTLMTDDGSEMLYYQTLKVDGCAIEVSDGGGGGSAVLIEKSITENGTYNAEDDDADGYSSVVADIPPYFTCLCTTIGTQSDNPYTVFWNKSNEVDVMTQMSYEERSQQMRIVEPIKTLRLPALSPPNYGFYIQFIPEDGFKLYINDEEVDIDEIFIPYQTPEGPTYFVSGKRCELNATWSPYDGVSVELRQDLNKLNQRFDIR